MCEKGRGVVARENISKGDYVMEYSSARVYAKKERRKWEEEYALNDEECYIVDAQTPSGWMCVDGTRAYDSFGWHIIIVVCY